MTSPTEKMLTTSWNLVREAGTAVTDAAVNSDVGAKLARNLPKLKEVVSVGAGLALARKGTKVAANAVRRNPVAAIAGAVALAGVGLAVAVVRNRKKAARGRQGSEAGRCRAREAQDARCQEHARQRTSRRSRKPSRFARPRPSASRKSQASR